MFLRQRWRRAIAAVLLGAGALIGAGGLGLAPPEANTYAAPLEAITGYAIYDDSLTGGWVNWSWDSTINFSDSNHAFSGSRAIAWTATKGWAALLLGYPNNVDTSGYTTLSLALQASQAGQKVAVMVYNDQGQVIKSVALGNYGGDPPAGSYRRYDLPLADLGATNRKIKGLGIKESTGSAKPVMYVDQIQLTGGSAPTATPTKTTTTGATPTKTAAPGATPTTPPSSGSCLGVAAYSELRPENATANRTRVARPQVSTASYPGFQSYFDQITGDCQGTTEQILEWAAVKWNLPDRDWLKAVAAQETWWKQDIKGDYENCNHSWCLPGYPQPDYHSRSILQIMRTAWPGSWTPPSASVGQSVASTAFAADYYGAAMRMRLDGRDAILGSQPQGMWDAIASWNCGCRGGDNGSYATRIKQFLQDKPWRNSVGKAPWWF